MAKLLEGKPIAERIKEEIKIHTLNLKVKPVLVNIMIGDDPGAASYLKSQAKVAQELGIEYRQYNFKENTTEAGILDFIRELNANKSVHGIIIQNPIPAQIDYRKLSNFIDPRKDVEGINPSNIGRLFFGGSRLVPCTACAVMELILASGVDLYGKEVVVVGHSEIIGKPLALLLLERFATVTVCHIGTSKAGKLEGHIKRAEVLVVAAGRPGLIKGKWIKKGAVVIDVGINHVGGNIVGDVEFAVAKKKAAYITPVPGGVGPLTVAILMRNLIEAVSLQQSGEYS